MMTNLPDEAACITLRPDFELTSEIANGRETIRARWTSGEDAHGRAIDLPDDMPEEDRTSKIAVLLERCRRSIEANDGSTVERPEED